MTKALTGLVKKAVEIGVFTGFKISSNLSYDILQFLDDTLLICEGTWQNLWSVKPILRGFELVSGLGVNFWKSNLYAININKNFTEVESNFLSNKVADIPLNFLGIKVGSNPMRIDS